MILLIDLKSENVDRMVGQDNVIDKLHNPGITAQSCLSNQHMFLLIVHLDICVYNLICAYGAERNLIISEYVKETSSMITMGSVSSQMYIKTMVSG